MDFVSVDSEKYVTTTIRIRNKDKEVVARLGGGQFSLGFRMLVESLRPEIENEIAKRKGAEDDTTEHGNDGSQNECNAVEPRTA
jgi:hypothetical protein